MAARDNGKAKTEKVDKSKPIQVNAVVHTSIVQINSELESAKSRLNLALSILQQHLGIGTDWNYDMTTRSFNPPKKVTPKTVVNRISQDDEDDKKK
jgi:hypothetical protein